VTNKVHNLLSELGIDIDSDLVSVVVAAYEKHLTSGFEGKQHIVDLFSFDWEQGDSDTHYQTISGMGELSEEVNGKDMYFLKTAVIRGEFVPMKNLVSRPIEKKACDGCAGIAHCTKTVLSPYNGKVETQCNHCLIHDERMRQEGDPSGCRECNVTMCDHNPNRRITA